MCCAPGPCFQLSAWPPTLDIPPYPNSLKQIILELVPVLIHVRPVHEQLHHNAAAFEIVLDRLRIGATDRSLAVKLSPGHDRLRLPLPVIDRLLYPQQVPTRPLSSKSRNITSVARCLGSSYASRTVMLKDSPKRMLSPIATHAFTYSRYSSQSFYQSSAPNIQTVSKNPLIFGRMD